MNKPFIELGFTEAPSGSLGIPLPGSVTTRLAYAFYSKETDMQIWINAENLNNKLNLRMLATDDYWIEAIASIPLWSLNDNALDRIQAHLMYSSHKVGRHIEENANKLIETFKAQ